MISIIVPVYNVESYLVKCLDSCFNQTYAAIEVIAVNDGSKDNCGQILDDYAQKEPRLRVFHQENQGVVAARNVGITNAQGEWLAFVDSDDYLEPDAIENLLKVTVDNSAQIVVANYRTVNEKGDCLKNGTVPNNALCDEKESAILLLTEKLSFSLCGKLFHSSLFEGVKSDTSLKLGEDAYITTQLCCNASKIVVSDAVVYNYLQRSLSVTHKPSEAAINSNIDFIRTTRAYFSKKIYISDGDFVNALNYFIMKEYFTYLRMGGKYIESDVQKEVNTNCLLDVVACAMTPRWRILMLKAYRANVFYGKIVRFIILNLRKIRK